MNKDQFTNKSGVVRHFHINVSKYVDETTGQIVTGEVVVLELDNGETLFAPISAISRAMSAMIEKKDLFLLRKAIVEYVTGERILGAKFSWRPSDSREFTATTAGAFNSIEAIEPVDANWSALNQLPAYETLQDKTGNFVAQEAEEVPEEEEEDLPEGAEAATATATKKGRK